MRGCAVGPCPTAIYIGARRAGLGRATFQWDCLLLYQAADAVAGARAAAALRCAGLRAAELDVDAAAVPRALRDGSWGGALRGAAVICPVRPPARCAAPAALAAGPCVLKALSDIVGCGPLPPGQVLGLGTFERLARTEADGQPDALLAALIAALSLYGGAQVVARSASAGSAPRRPAPQRPAAPCSARLDLIN
jgi:hypothetical protein